MSSDPPAAGGRKLKRHRHRSIARALRSERARRFTLNHLFDEHLADNTLCFVPFDGFDLFVDPRDDKIAYTILSGRAWQRAAFDKAITAAMSRSHRPSGGVFVDVGANIGTFTIYALKSGHFSQAIAVEPDATNRRILERNLEHNNLSDSVTIVDAAASTEAGTAILYRDSKNYGAHSLVKSFSKSQTSEQHVRIDRLDALIRQAGFAPDMTGFVKIDVEGHEAAVLGGMPQTLAAKPPIMIELTCDEAANRQFAPPTCILAELASHYAECLVLDDAQSAPIPLAAFKPTKPQHDVLVF